MNIKIAWDFCVSSYQSLFPEAQLFDWEKHNRREVIDLMIFPGGEDVSLEFYCDRQTIMEWEKICYTDRERDNYELNILDACYDGRIRVKKILGVCRGMQLLNVMFDGKLFPDLYSVSLGHERIHKILHSQPNNLDFMTTVNSLHHQGLKELGKFNRSGNRLQPIIIATDAAGIVPEIVTWDNDTVLGVQFHPEFYDNSNPDKGKFRDFCYSWINGETKILK